MGILIRPIHDDEKERIAVAELLGKAGWNLSPDGLYNTGPSMTLVLYVDDKLIGTLGIKEYRRICNVTVDPNYRGLHYGWLLMQASQAYTRGRPYLFVKMFNWKAIRLYLIEGYRITGRRKKSWRMEKQDD